MADLLAMVAGLSAQVAQQSALLAQLHQQGSPEAVASNKPPFESFQEKNLAMLCSTVAEDSQRMYRGTAGQLIRALRVHQRYKRMKEFSKSRQSREPDFWEIFCELGPRGRLRLLAQLQKAQRKQPQFLFCTVADTRGVFCCGLTPILFCCCGSPMKPYLLLSFAIALPLASGFAEEAKKLPPPEKTEPATWCRFVPERADDFAWENDLIAFRAYGPALAKAKALENSGVDVWLKSVPYPIIDRRYALQAKGFSYHQDYGEGNDPYHTGASRGCGGTALWKNGDTLLSGPFKEWKIISRESGKSVFVLVYEYATENIREEKQITIELGQRLFRSESVFTRNGQPVVGLEVAIGVTTHSRKAKPVLNPAKGWMACWETIENKGLGTGVLIAPEAIAEMKQHTSPTCHEDHALLVTRTDAAGRTVHYAGYAWEGARSITNLDQWQDYLTQFAQTLSSSK